MLRSWLSTGASGSGRGWPARSSSACFAATVRTVARHGWRPADQGPRGAGARQPRPGTAGPGDRGSGADRARALAGVQGLCKAIRGRTTIPEQRKSSPRRLSRGRQKDGATPTVSQDGDGSAVVGVSRPPVDRVAQPDARLPVERAELTGDRATAARGSVRDRRGARRTVGRVDRPRAGRGGVRLRLRAPRRSAPAVGRGLHHAPGRRGQDLRRHAPRHRDAVRGAAARHGRGHARVAGGGARGVRRGDRRAGRRRHQAHRADLPVARRGAGRELPQDDGRDGDGHPGHPDQARRPPAQHAHDRRDAQAEADREGARDARHLRADRPPARYPRDQVGARGPGLPDPAPAQVQRDQGAGRPAARRARALRQPGRRLPGQGARRARDPGRDLRSGQALLLDLLEDDQEGARVQRDLRPDRDAGDRRARSRTATARSA